MKTTQTLSILVLVFLVLAAVGGCKSKESSKQGQATSQQDEAAKSLGIPKELTLDLGNKVMMKLVEIPAGKFMMGSPASEKDRSSEEGPQHEVTITKPFYMGVYEVTQEQYEQIMGKDLSSLKGAPKNPVECVSWDDAVEFCKKLSAKTGKTVSLPTEAQWEYACRAGTKTRFGFGDKDEDLGDYAWWGGDKDSSEEQTHPVGRKKPNAWGLYDMHGNVWEWCSDWYADSYANAKNQDPQGPDSGWMRVLRGGGWLGQSPQDCRSALRVRGTPGFDGLSFGFRVVMLAAGVDSPSTQPATQPLTRPASGTRRPTSK